MSQSNWITNKLKSLDHLGHGINFTIHNQPHLQTVCGGILRIIIYLIGLFLAYFFGQDFIQKTNPQVDFEIKETLLPINFTYKANDFIFAIKFENTLHKNINVSDYFHIITTLDTYKIVNSEYILESKNIPMVRCNDMKYDEEIESFFSKVSKYKQYFCPLIAKDTEITINGNFEHLFDINTINLKLNLCLNVENKTNKNCKNYKKFFNEILKNDDLYVDMIINEVDFDRDDIDYPLKKKLRTTGNILSPNMVKRDYVLLTKSDVIEDDGYILSNKFIYSEYGFSSKRSEFFFFNNIDSDDDITPLINEYYSLNIVGDFKYKQFSRKYMKFQNVLALLVSFMNLLISMIRGIYAFYYRFRLRTYFFRKLVRIPADKAQEEGKNIINISNQHSKIELKAASNLTERQLKLRDSPRNSIEKPAVSNIRSFINSPINDNENNLDNNNHNEKSKIKVENKEIEKNKAFIANMEKMNTNKNSSLVLLASLDNNEIEKVYDSFVKKETNNFSFWFNLKTKILKNNTKNSKYLLKSEDYYELFRNKFDIFYYLKKMKSISLMKKLMFEENVLNLVNLLSNKYYTLDESKNTKTDNNQFSKVAFEKKCEIFI